MPRQRWLLLVNADFVAKMRSFCCRRRASSFVRRDFNQPLTIHRANSAYLGSVSSWPEVNGEPSAMAINDLPILSALRTKMQWDQEHQRVLAENISNANTPNFKPSDLVEPKFDRGGSAVG